MNSNSQSLAVRPQLAPEKLAAAITYTRNKLIWHDRARHYSIKAEDAPSERLLAALRDRRASLILALAPGNLKLITEFVIKATVRYPSSGNGGPESFQIMLAAYVEDLQRFPLWAVEEGLRAAVKGRDQSSRPFLPASAEWVQGCVQATRPWFIEIEEIGKILNASIEAPVSPGEQARVSAGFQDLLKDLAAPEAPVQEAPPVSPEERLAQLKDLPVPEISPTLAARLGLQPKNQDQDQVPGG